MGYLLKEALKALCGVNQWSYAVFWKIGCQNPKLLIWEECYYGSSTSAPQNSNLGNHEISFQKQEGYNNGMQVGDKLHLLIERMMISNHVNVVGEGLAGRAAFTGNHQWIISGMYNEISHPAEVLNEVHLQLSAGMQTIAVIPIAPHGVVQLGSSSTIMETVGFVHDVRNFFLQLGCIPSVFISDNYFTKDAASTLGLSVADVTANPINLHGNPTPVNSTDIAAGDFNLQRNSSEIHRLVNQSSDCFLTQFQDNLQVSGSIFMMPNLNRDSCKASGDHEAAMISRVIDSNVLPNGLAANQNTRGVVMPCKSDSMQPSSNIPGTGVSCPQSTADWHPTLLKQQIVLHDGSVEGKYGTSTSVFNHNDYHCAALNQNNTLLSAKNVLGIGINCEHDHSFQTSARANMVVQDTDSSVEDGAGLLKTDKSSSSNKSAGVLNRGNYARHIALTTKYTHGKLWDSDRPEVQETSARKHVHIQSGNYVPPSKDTVLEDIFIQSSAGDDLFDVLGVDLKNKLLNGNTSNLPDSFCGNSKNQSKDLPKFMDLQNFRSEVYSDYEGISGSVVFSSSGSDHLLDAMISGVGSVTRQISDDDASCKTTVSKISSYSIPSTPNSNPLSSGMFNMSDRMQSQLFGPSKPVSRLVEPIGNAVGSSCGKNDDRSCTYGLQISSWIEQGPSTSVSTANSKKSDGGKSNRKRLKPGENPRPRPKDRQMIQDRVKELRDIVPNGAKCSIDALLERTIKHMLFLQSVTDHADKLKQTVESKIAKKQGGMSLSDEFQGSATWAFELGSQSLVCPIVVEDLNPPRQLLIEMLCEKRGFFLEIADIIRGLGLTILKGVMEVQNDKIWARFAVEANRDVTRMEVFISLVHLLEETLKGSTASVHGTNDENMGVLPAPIPANQQLVCGEPSTRMM
ncbi:transcription factor LHW-like [Spinacia oleracea]|uniref:Transcription factor LHW-like n=1 Tax=Spinacia oleracea TaxID=3562 RepID=A0A9R0K6G2_SPIOL|nr:transcription factor LHW-like [Spinacia oleracea]